MNQGCAGHQGEISLTEASRAAVEKGPEHILASMNAAVSLAPPGGQMESGRQKEVAV